MVKENLFSLPEQIKEWILHNLVPTYGLLMIENRIYGGHKCCQCDGTPAPSYGGSLHCMPSYYLIDTDTELLGNEPGCQKKGGCKILEPYKKSAK